MFVAHPRYPVLMPLAQVVVQETFDVGDDRRAIKPLYAAFFPALLLVFFDIARRHAGTGAAALTATALAAVPFLAFSDFGGADGAFSDVPLGAFVGSGFLLLLGRVRPSEGVGAALLLGAAVLTKNEGLPFAVAALAALAFLAVRERHARRRRRVAALFLAAAAVLAGGLALRTWQSRVPQRWDEDYAGRLGKVSLAAEARARLPLLPRAVMKEMTDWENLAGFGFAGVVVLVAGAGGLRRRVVPAVVLFVYFCFAAYVLALLLSPWGGVEQLHPTWYRLLTQVSLPLGLLLALALRAGWRALYALDRHAATSVATDPRNIHGYESTRRTRGGWLVFLGLAAFPVLAVYVLTLRNRAPVERAVLPVVVEQPVPSGPVSAWREDVLLTGSVDVPPEGTTVRGELLVRGWARIPGEDLRVVVLVDGVERPFVRSSRAPRRDVQDAVPSLGDCASAGYEFAYSLSRNESGPHVIHVLFRTRDGRERHYPARRFRWEAVDTEGQRDNP